MAHLQRLPVPIKCDACGSKRIRNAIVDVPEEGLRNVWRCDECDAAAWCHEGSLVPKAYMADRSTRGLRVSVHNAFDKLWKEKSFASRDAAYRWMSTKLNVPDAHIGTLTKEQLLELLHLCRRFKVTEAFIQNRREEKKNDRAKASGQRAFARATARRKNSGITKQKRIKEHCRED